MSNTPYMKYLETTNYYKELTSSFSKITKIKENIDSLIQAMGEPNGPMMTNLINELKGFKNDLESVYDHYDDLFKTVLLNAYMYDSKYNQYRTSGSYLNVWRNSTSGYLCTSKIDEEGDHPTIVITTYNLNGKVRKTEGFGRRF